MKEKKQLTIDFTVRELAEKSKNQTAITGVIIMNTILAVAYLIEVLKNARSITSYGVILALCVLPCVFAGLLYKNQGDSLKIRYVLGGGFAILYGYIRWTTTNEVTFCYIIVILVVLIVYVDLKYLVGLGVYALLLNVVIVVRKIMSGTLTGDAITNAEIVVACLFLTTYFTVLSIRKISQINTANIQKAETQKSQSESLLNTTLAVAGTMTSNIEEAVGETEQLKDTISETQKAMAKLVTDTEEEGKAIEAQKQSTDKINEYILGVGDAVDSIVREVDSTEEKLDSGNDIMKELLDQVRVSEQSNEMVVQKMEGLRESAGKMQAILEMIRNVADQTGLLALNASIEAARAGEAGKGFAVVATEITNLSAQTNDATGDIDTLIEEIVSSVEDVTLAMNKLLTSTQLQNQYVNSTAESFGQIHASTENIARQVSHLKETVNIVTKENRYVAESIDNVEAVMRRVMDGANATYENCNINLESVANVADVMDNLSLEASKLQN